MAKTDNISTLRFSIHRAVDNIDICRKYIDGHVRVLKVYGISQITSAKIDWIVNPNVYVLVVERVDTGELMAGSRLQISDDKFHLPIEDAVGHKDSSVYNYVKNLREGGVAELCGLWNSRHIAGFGIGSIFLGRTSIAAASQLKIKSLVALCAPSTRENCFRTGFLVEKSLGNKGEFIYPKEDLVATSLIIPDVHSLNHATNEERDRIFLMRDKWHQKVVEKTNRGNIRIEYNLEIQNINSPEALKTV